MIRILANENIPGEAVKALREEGINVKWVSEFARGSADLEVALSAFKEKRILLTFDKDFGEQIYRRGAAHSYGIILLRISPASANSVAGFLKQLFKKEIKWEGHFASVSSGGVRLLPLPSLEG